MGVVLDPDGDVGCCKRCRLDADGGGRGVCRGRLAAAAVAVVAGVSATGAVPSTSATVTPSSIVGASGDGNIVAADIGRVAVHLVRRRRDQGGVAALQSLDHRGNLGAERAGRIEQCVAALRRVEIGHELFECLEVGDQRGNGLGVAAADEVDGLLPERIDWAMKLAANTVCTSLSRCVGAGFVASGSGEKPLMPLCVAMSASLGSP